MEEVKRVLGWLYFDQTDGSDGSAVRAAPLSETDRAELRELLRAAHWMAHYAGSGDCKMTSATMADAAERWGEEVDNK